MRTVPCSGRRAGGLPGGGCLGGGLPWGVCPSACWDTWTEFLTHACENITFPQLFADSKYKISKRESG